ncbi:MAG: hypothetical protein AUK30_10315 [Nitrospirae bacterium CG2_30_70_394]|nr:MAG: hypothetical protein AUK30_10315 [Nitrospirae bacterium CG2_30_70_394]
MREEADPRGVGVDEAEGDVAVVNQGKGGGDVVEPIGHLQVEGGHDAPLQQAVAANPAGGGDTLVTRFGSACRTLSTLSDYS